MLVAKVMAHHLKSACEVLIDEIQSAFLPGRSLQEGFALSQEIITSLHTDRRSGAILKLDFSKAFDRIEWDFPFKILDSHGFLALWVKMIANYIKTAKALVLNNGSLYRFFAINPLSPLLFSLVANVLSRMCKKVEEAGWIKGLSCAIVGGTPVTHLQYADDTMFFAVPSIEVVAGFRIILHYFTLVSGLSINWAKSSIITVNVEQQKAAELAALLGCKIQTLPNKHLGLPLVTRRLLRRDWTPVIERIQRRLGGYPIVCSRSKKPYAAVSFDVAPAETTSAPAWSNGRNYATHARWEPNSNVSSETARRYDSGKSGG
ncbi:hypothetical protein QJS10_CPB04g01254 [Acorus calamus]|uniref:Reverse transcriptase domain-containing protein n=1 Tax=Acorus calamus TaxID=4465 RepID=A0AAV9F1D8_ACOCL|nr:hypothetical protein QJS10_CPB04g01254 [Acorus calamus]